MELSNILIIVSTVLGLAAIFFTAKWALTKKLIKEITEVMISLSAAIEDDKVTSEEVAGFLKECADVVLTVKELFKG